MTRIVNRTTAYATPWFELVAKQVAGQSAPFYALRMRDYVSVVALTEDAELVLVRQYRPAIERHTLELPSGMVESDETPAESAGRELGEECGFRAQEIELLGTLVSDTGRNENRLWCYLARGLMPMGAGYAPEPGVQRVLLPRTRLRESMISGEFDHALNLAAMMLAVARLGPDFLALEVGNVSGR